MVALQVRDVPDDVRDDLAREARRRGGSLQTYLLEVLTREARAARNRELLRSWTPVRGTASSESAGGPVDVARIIREDRAERERHLLDVAIDSPRS